VLGNAWERLGTPNFSLAWFVKIEMQQSVSRRYESIAGSGRLPRDNTQSSRRKRSFFSRRRDTVFKERRRSTRFCGIETPHFCAAWVHCSLCVLRSKPFFKTCQLKSWRSQGVSLCSLRALCVLCAKLSFGLEKTCQLKSWRSQSVSLRSLCVLCARLSFGLGKTCQLKSWRSQGVPKRSIAA